MDSTAARARAAALAVLTAVVLAGCTGGGGDEAAETPTVAPERPGPRTPVSRIDVTREQDGMEVTLLRIARLGEGGRVFLRAYNGTGQPASVLSRDMEFLQGGARLRPSPDPIGRTPDFPQAIEPGASSTAVQYYRALQPGPARLVVDWISRDLGISPQPFEFTFRVR